MWSFDGQRVVVSEDKGKKPKSGRDRRAGMGFGIHEGE
jgi:hypothetical protein